MTKKFINKKLQGKVAIVTGGARGIGEATALVLADHGARAVVIADIQPEKGRVVAESIGLERCNYVQCDVADEEQRLATDSPGAGVFGVRACEARERAWRGGMCEAGTRKMVEMGKSAGKASQNWTDYGMSKWAVLGLMRAASLQLGKHGIRVNSVSPAVVLTSFLVKYGIVTPADVDNLKGATLTTQNVAFLASNEAVFVTGVDLAVDGGMIAEPFDLSN
ncbi:hypothetical protein SASPL_129987 [Salvia splendens]|uniref:Xanthoxin dehydrogenase n=1 Tax=Salvia splendens TaxID=180675 RepID=A0A8X8ZJ79_SALSN|nr:hypothetical protein SASPL_129987 [Salvia splendens]